MVVGLVFFCWGEISTYKPVLSVDLRNVSRFLALIINYAGLSLAGNQTPGHNRSPSPPGTLPFRLGFFTCRLLLDLSLSFSLSADHVVVCHWPTIGFWVFCCIFRVLRSLVLLPRSEHSAA